MQENNVSIHAGTTTHGSLLDELGCILEVASNVLGEASALLLVKHLPVEGTHLRRRREVSSQSKSSCQGCAQDFLCW